jgi:signal transduction histidine kinase
MYGGKPDETLSAAQTSELRSALERVGRGEHVNAFETVRRRRDGSVVDVSLSVSPVLDSRGRIVAASVSGRDITERKRAEDELRELNADLSHQVDEQTEELQQSVEQLRAEIARRGRAEERLRALNSELLMTEERERRRLARDLHDGLGQTLTVAAMRLATLREKAAGDLRRLVAEVEELLLEAHKSASSLTFQLSPPMLYDMGLVPALEWLCEEMKRAYGLEVALHAVGQPITLDDEMRVAVFRSLRELLINVAKHAGTRCARVSLCRTVGGVRIAVADDGIGFDTSTAGGFGLASVRERIEHLGGSFVVDSAPGTGTTALLLAPLVRRRPGRVLG